MSRFVTALRIKSRILTADKGAVKFTDGTNKVSKAGLSVGQLRRCTWKDTIQDVNVDSELERARSTMWLKQGASLNTAAEFATALPLAVKQILISWRCYRATICSTCLRCAEADDGAYRHTRELTRFSSDFDKNDPRASYPLQRDDV